MGSIDREVFDDDCLRFYAVNPCIQGRITFFCCVRMQYENWPVTMVAESPPLFYRASDNYCYVLQSTAVIGEGARLVHQNAFIGTVQPTITPFIIYYYFWPLASTICGIIYSATIPQHWHFNPCHLRIITQLHCYHQRGRPQPPGLIIILVAGISAATTAAAPASSIQHKGDHGPLDFYHLVARLSGDNIRINGIDTTLGRPWPQDY